MIKVIADLCPSMFNHFPRKMQIIKVLNPHPLYLVKQLGVTVISEVAVRFYLQFLRKIS